jgi:hypothetical protein
LAGCITLGTEDVPNVFDDSDDGFADVFSYVFDNLYGYFDYRRGV